MKNLEQLIKLAEFEIEEIKINLNKINTQLEQLEIAINSLIKSLKEELDVTKNSPELANDFLNFAKNNQARQEELKSYKIELEKRAELINDQLRDKYSEQKKYEKVKAKLLNEINQSLLKNENKQLDEFSLQQHFKK